MTRKQARRYENQMKALQFIEMCDLLSPYRLTAERLQIREDAWQELMASSRIDFFPSH